MANNATETVIKQPGWWRRRNKLERSLTIIAVLFAIIAIGQVIALGLLSTSLGKSNVCVTPECVSEAASFLNHIDTDVDPCDNFYKFACGKFLKNTRIPREKFSVNIFSILIDDLNEKLRGLLEEEAAENEPDVFQQTRNVYKSCMNTTEIEKQGNQPILDVLEELGKWPVLVGESWSNDSFNWISLVKKFTDIGFGPKYLFELYVSADNKNSSVRTISIDQPRFGLHREYLLKGEKEKTVAEYYNYMVDIAVLLGADRAFAENELLDALQLEVTIANITAPQEERRNYTANYNRYTVGELGGNFSSIPWLTFLNNLHQPYNTITESDYVIVEDKKYLHSLEDVLKNTNTRVLANLMLWRAVKDIIDFSNDALRERQLTYKTVLAGVSTREERWIECVEAISESLSIAIGAMYVRRYFDKNEKNAAIELIHDINNEFRGLLEGLDWMDKKTKVGALEKLDKVTAHMAYPDELLDDSKLNEFYRGLEIPDNMYLKSMLSYNKFAMISDIKLLREAVNRTDWKSHGKAAVVNAYYNLVENSIQFPAGILQGKMFSAKRPKYMNYGAIGYIIAHEITHGFDDQGSQFDKDGNLFDWWEKETKAQYLKRTKCIIEQYGNYTNEETGLNVNGINTQGENIADNVGMKEAYFAYQKWVNRNGEEQTLPGLPYSPKQLFWLSSANSWCTVIRPQFMKQEILTGVHAPCEFRVDGPMRNMAEFARDFNCPLKSYMNPEDKCTVW